MAYKKNDFSLSLHMTSSNVAAAAIPVQEQLAVSKQKSVINSAKLQTLKKDKGKMNRPEILHNNDQHETIKS